MRKRYSLESLLRHRQDVVDARARSLSVRARESQAAASRRADADGRAKDHDAQTAKERETELERVDDKGATVEELLRLQAWEMRRQLEAAELQKQASRARDAEHQAQQHEREARQVLASAHVDAKLVGVHKDRFLQQQERLEQEQQDEESQEVFTARLGRGRT